MQERELDLIESENHGDYGDRRVTLKYGNSNTVLASFLPFGFLQTGRCYSWFTFRKRSGNVNGYMIEMT